MITRARQIAIGGEFKSEWIPQLAAAMKEDRSFFVFDKPPVAECYYESNAAFRERMAQNIKDHEYYYPNFLWSKNPTRKEKGNEGRWLVLYTLEQNEPFKNFFALDFRMVLGTLPYRTSDLNNISYRYVLPSFSIKEEVKTEPVITAEPVHEPVTILTPELARDMKRPEFWQNGFTEKDARVVYSAICQGKKIRKQQAISVLIDHMVELGISLRDLRK